MTARLVEELEPRVNSESKRGEVHLIVHGARFLHVSLDGAGPVANIGASSDAGPFDAASSRLRVKPGELADRYAASAAQTVRRLNPCAWHPTYRKSDLRHALCALLHAVLAPVAGARIPEGASDYTKRDWAEAVTTCREDVDKWLRSKEKKHAAAGLPLLGALHAAETLCGGDGGAGLHAFLDIALLRAFREPRHRAAAADALRAAVEGIAPPLPPGVRHRRRRRRRCRNPRGVS